MTYICLKNAMKKSPFWNIIRSAKISLKNIKTGFAKREVEKYDGKPLTTIIQSKIQETIKSNRAIYFHNEEVARSLANNWQGVLDLPQNITFIEGAIPVVLCANDKFAPYTAVMLQSILDNSNPKRKYHFIIFEQDFLDKTKKYLIEQLSKFSHCFIDFITTKNAFTKIPIPVNTPHFSTDIFSRYFIPYWLDKYPKVIYCDSDMLAKTDIAELYDFDIQNYCIGAAANQWICATVGKQKYSTLVNFAVFAFHNNWERYINSGLLLFNTKAFRKKFSYQDLFKFTIYYTNRYKRIFPDQDILSLLIKDDYYLLPPAWNYCWEKSITADADSFQKNETSAKIIHFTSNIKPWKNLPEIANNPDAIAYREYAKNVPLYDLLHCKDQ